MNWRFKIVGLATLYVALTSNAVFGRISTEDDIFSKCGRLVSRLIPRRLEGKDQYLSSVDNQRFVAEALKFIEVKFRRGEPGHFLQSPFASTISPAPDEIQANPGAHLAEWLSTAGIKKVKETPERVLRSDGSEYPKYYFIWRSNKGRSLAGFIRFWELDANESDWEDGYQPSTIFIFQAYAITPTGDLVSVADETNKWTTLALW